MNQLYPIIRRARRPLLPADEPVPPQKLQPAEVAPETTEPDVANGAGATNDETKADASSTQ